MWNTCRVKEKIQDPYIWFNELYNVNLKLKKIKEKMRNIFDILPEKYKAVRVSCNSNIPNMSNKDLNKETC